MGEIESGIRRAFRQQRSAGTENSPSGNLEQRKQVWLCRLRLVDLTSC